MNEEMRVEEVVENNEDVIEEFTGVAVNGKEPNTLGYTVGILGLVGITIASYEGGKYLAKKSIGFIEKKRNEKKLKNYKKEIEESERIELEKLEKGDTQEDSKNEKIVQMKK